MHMRDVFRWGAERLPRHAAAGLAALILAAPIQAQVVTAGPAQVKRDSVMVRLGTVEMERRLKARLDSLRVTLEREPASEQRARAGCAGAGVAGFGATFRIDRRSACNASQFTELVSSGHGVSGAV